MQTDPDTRSPEGSESIHFAGFALDVTGCTLTAANGQDVPLRRAEFALLLAFLRSPGGCLAGIICWTQSPAGLLLPMTAVLTCW